MLTKFIIPISVLFCWTNATPHPLFAFQDCGGSKMKFDNISISPLPIKFSKTDKIYISAKVEILEDLPLDAMSRLTLTKLVEVDNQTLEVEIPCVDDMGSCELKVCDIFSKWYKDVVCPFFTKAGVQCQCPVHSGLFESKDVKVEVPFAKIQGMIAYLASGDYKIEFRITDGTNQTTYSCLNIQANVVFEK